jgi:NAD(P)-dependent dehydrogenase (short-subunit alcohol dehydrogenase family)
MTDADVHETRKVAVVTGASQGIGAGVVEGYRKLGYAVVANSRNIKPSEHADLVTVQGDIGDRTVAGRIVATALDRFGRIDSLINNAGIFIGKPFLEYTQNDFERALATNVAGFFHLTQLAIGQMVKQGCGHVVQITTTLVDQAIAQLPAAMAALSKGGLDAVTRSLAVEFAKSGIRVNAVAPGIIKTPIFGPDAPMEFLATLQPIGHLGEIADIVGAIVYLESAEHVTGVTLNVDGGQVAGRW